MMGLRSGISSCRKVLQSALLARALRSKKLTILLMRPNNREREETLVRPFCVAKFRTCAMHLTCAITSQRSITDTIFAALSVVMTVRCRSIFQAAATDLMCSDRFSAVCDSDISAVLSTSSFNCQLSSITWAVTVVNPLADLLVQPSFVRVMNSHLLRSCSTCLQVSSYINGISLLVTWVRLSKSYLGSRTRIKFINPGSFTE